jgi:hypothetical protein
MSEGEMFMGIDTRPSGVALLAAADNTAKLKPETMVLNLKFP